MATRCGCCGETKRAPRAWCGSCFRTAICPHCGRCLDHCARERGCVGSTMRKLLLEMRDTRIALDGAAIYAAEAQAVRRRLDVA